MRHVIVSDFDETITRRDTISVLARIPYAVKRGLPPWEHFADAYYANWRQAHAENQDLRRLPLLARVTATSATACGTACATGSAAVAPAPAGITRENFPVLFREEIEYQRNSRAIELASTVEMAKQGVFRGVSHRDVRGYVENLKSKSPSKSGSADAEKDAEEGEGEEQGVEVRDGVFAVIGGAVPRERCYVLSVNWSREFIHAFVDVPPQNIYCNRLLSEDGTYTGEFENEVLCGSDKIAKLHEILDKETSGSDAGADNTVWYVGDSETDLLPILYPGVNGVLLIDPAADSEKFEKLAAMLGLDHAATAAALQAAPWTRCLEKDPRHGLYLALSWHAINDLIKTY
ncbi:Cto1p RNJ42_00030 [Nakaseomyces bracarensis]|uniref:Cto1p n=1 Tax=Nakaseomyces bracarensis TaxID=273131 RepID=UPI003872934A